MTSDISQRHETRNLPENSFATAPVIGIAGDGESEVLTGRQPDVRAAHRDFAAFHEQYVSRYIGLADTKAAWSFATASGALLYLMSKEEIRERLLVTDPAVWWIVAVPVGLLGASAVAAFLVIVPRLSTSGEGIIYFGAVSKYVDSTRYVQAVAKLTEPQITTTRLIHCFDIAKVAVTKYRLLRIAMWSGALGLLSSLLPFFLYLH